MVQCISTLVAVLSVFVASSIAHKCPGIANYKLTFRTDWTVANHPNTPLPGNAHFSPLIGCSHNSNYIMWRRGMEASPGVKLVAERGRTETLKTEIENQISAKKAWQLILPGGSPQPVAEQTGINVQVTSNYSKVSLISMLAPSPDWYVGIDSHDLCDDGKWRETWNVTMLPPYDSGTDSGPDFNSDNNATNPPEPIFRITNDTEGSFKAANPIASLGEFKFKWVAIAPEDNSASMISVSLIMIISTAFALAFF